MHSDPAAAIEDLKELRATQAELVKSRGDWFTTATGKVVFVMSPEQSEVCIEDIAISLSRQTRFAGHLRSDVETYSVAQHSVLVSRMCSPEHALVGLLHDATEAYLQDIVRPLKHVLGKPYAQLEHAWALRIGRALGVGDALAELPLDVTVADRRALATERRDLLVQNAAWSHNWAPYEERIEWHGSRYARAQFTLRYEALRQGEP